MNCNMLLLWPKNTIYCDDKTTLTELKRNHEKKGITVSEKLSLFTFI